MAEEENLVPLPEFEQRIVPTRGLSSIPTKTKTS